MKLFAILIICIALISVYRWLENSTPSLVVLPTPQQLNKMVGLEDAPRVPLWLADAGN
ncbi:hypothetical protein [Marinomonas gallaica]|uniref:hypothetical protein n=1 Tax=Marinomonas gallaica TaxID=1806667 RepID=UPI000A5D7E1E|nr:hypothetical protein [Marinomonas gallaica]